MPELFSIHPFAGEVLLLTAVFFPLLLGLFGLSRRTAAWAFAAAPVAALPGLLLSVSTPVGVNVNTLILGSRFVTGGAGSVWLFLTALLWFCAAWFGVHYLARDPRRGFYTFFFLGTMSGNIGLVVAGDPIIFITFFALMSFLSYGLIIHDRKPASMRAGRVYLAMAVLGEVLQFAGLARLAFPIIGRGELLQFQSLGLLADADSVVVMLLIGGFGVKAGLLGLHMWLPMAHPVAPTPASAVLSGSMIKAGLIGWMVLLPLGVTAMPRAGALLIVLGLSGAFAAALFGMVQKQAKAVLAYSSVSQMGLIITVFGVGLAHPASWDRLLWVVVIYAAHHAFAKCLLFLSVGLKTTRPLIGWEGRLVRGGTVFTALALSGAPLTSGMAAKLVLKNGIDAAGPVQVDLILTLLTVAAIGTTLLMARFLDVLRTTPYDRDHRSARVIVMPWLLLLSMVGGLAWYLAVQAYPSAVVVWNKPAYWMNGLWPIAVGGIIYAAGVTAGRRRGWNAPQLIPPGDMYHPVCRAVFGCTAAMMSGFKVLTLSGGLAAGALEKKLKHTVSHCVTWCEAVESRLAIWQVGGAVVTTAAALFFWLVLR